MKIKTALKWLHSGTFDFRSHEYRDHKFNRPIDNLINYLSQLPYLKVIGIPLGFIIFIIQWSPVLAHILLELIVHKIREIRNCMKKKAA